MWQELKEKRVLIFNNEVPLLFILAIFIPIILVNPIRLLFHPGNLINPGKWSINTNDSLGYRFEYPGAFLVFNYDEYGASKRPTLRSDVRDIDFEIHEIPLDEDLEFSEAMNELENRVLRTSGGIAVDRPESVAVGVGSYPATKMTYMKDDRLTELYILVQEDKAIAIEITNQLEAYDENYDAYYQRMLNSFEFVEVSD